MSLTSHKLKTCVFYVPSYKFDYFGEVIEGVFSAYSRKDGQPIFMFPGSSSNGIISNLKYGGKEIGVIQTLTHLEDNTFGFGGGPDNLRIIGE